MLQSDGGVQGAPRLDYDAWRDVLRSTCGNTVTLNLPRESLVSHLGFEPKGGLYRRGGTPAGRLLFDLIQETDGGEGSALSPAHLHMHLAVYDLVGALFAPPDPWPVSPYADKLFARICGVIKGRFADPDFGPSEVAAEAGISLRYLQKLFTRRGSTCSEFIYSLRLDHAARLLHRRAFLATNQPVSEIAYASGSACQRDRLRQRLSRLHKFRPKISPSVRSLARRLRGRSRLAEGVSVPLKVRHWLTTFDLARSRFDLRKDDPVRALRPKNGK